MTSQYSHLVVVLTNVGPRHLGLPVPSSRRREQNELSKDSFWTTLPLNDLSGPLAVESSLRTPIQSRTRRLRTPNHPNGVPKMIFRNSLDHPDFGLWGPHFQSFGGGGGNEVDMLGSVDVFPL